MESESCILSEIDESLTTREKAYIERIIREEISRSERTFNCVLQDIEKSVSFQIF